MATMNSSTEGRRISNDPRLNRPVRFYKSVSISEPEQKVQADSVSSLETDLKSKIRQDLEWIEAEPIANISLKNLTAFMKIGDRSLTRLTETKFCDGQTYDELCKLKDFYRKLPNIVAASARGRSNPFERIENGIFQNRAAMKLANIDYDLNFELTDPRKPDKTPIIPNNDVLHFVDICAGPGGFSEYILWRRGFAAKGIGITLRNGECGFNKSEFQAGPIECYELDYGQNNNGDIYDPLNVSSFIDNVMKSTEGIGVQLVVADGGIEAKGKEDQHENFCKQLYLAEFIIGLSVLKPNGIMVCKMFDTYSPFTVGLIYLVHLCFNKTAIYKPHSSRPQNSERYMICKYKREGIEPIIKYFSHCHKLMFDWTKTQISMNHVQDFDILELVPMEILKARKKDEEESCASSFFPKMNNFNNMLAKRQIAALITLKTYMDNTSSHPEQTVIRQKCFEEWQVPIPIERRYPKKKKCEEMTDETFDRLWNIMDHGVELVVGNIRDLREQELNSKEFEAHFKSPYDWRIIVVQGRGSSIKESRGFYMSQGGTDVFRYNGNEWVEISISIELPKDTLIYGEIVTEFAGLGMQKKKEQTFHIIDALIINGTTLCDKHYIYRHEMCTRLAKAVNKSSHCKLNLVRAKQLVRMENIADVLDKCTQSEIKDENGHHWMCPIDHTDERSPVIKAAGIMLLKLTKHPWMMCASRRSGQKYWFNVQTRESRYEIPPDSVSTFIDTMQERVLWKWTPETSMNANASLSSTDDDTSAMTNGEVHASKFMKFITNFQAVRVQN